MARRLVDAKPLLEPDAETLLTSPIGTNFSEILNDIHIFH